MSTGLKKALILLLFALAVIGGVLIWNNINQPELPSGYASGNGRIEAVQVDVSSKIAGRVEHVIAQEGELVQQGDTLATIDTAQLKAQLLRAKAEVASAESQVASAQASIAQAKAKLTLAQQELSRSRELTKKGFASKESNDTLISQVAVANADVKAAQAALVSRERNVDAALASQAEIQTQIDDAVLSAPSIGRVLYRLAEPGEVIGSGGKVMTLVNLSDVYMELYLPSSQVNRVAIGAQARIKLDILEAAIPATVSFVSPESQFTPKEVETASERDKLMFRVKVRVPQTLVLKHINQVKTGIRGVAYVQLTPLPGEEIGPWPEFLQTLAQ
ncbi:HlyD family secretion protein [Neptunomonas phycophila]|uniref:HlyD family secretion protein n=1 Tax=Neptunomonas phycophila TaxID=1572645 RepID=UPI0030F4B3FC